MEKDIVIKLNPLIFLLVGLAGCAAIIDFAIRLVSFFINSRDELRKKGIISSTISYVLASSFLVLNGFFSFIVLYFYPNIVEFLPLFSIGILIFESVFITTIGVVFSNLEKK